MLVGMKLNPSETSGGVWSEGGDQICFTFSCLLLLGVSTARKLTGNFWQLMQPGLDPATSGLQDQLQGWSDRKLSFPPSFRNKKLIDL